MRFACLKRREFIAFIGLATALPLAVHAQQPAKIPRIGVLSLGRPSAGPDPIVNIINSFLQGLRELGYTDGQNVIIQQEYTEGNTDRLHELAIKLIAAKVDVIVAFSTTAARAAKQATSTIPIVAISMADPVADGLVESLARPGGNVTGTSFLGPGARGQAPPAAARGGSGSLACSGTVASQGVQRTHDGRRRE